VKITATTAALLTLAALGALWVAYSIALQAAQALTDAMAVLS
jgi:hypothetical protein